MHFYYFSSAGSYSNYGKTFFVSIRTCLRRMQNGLFSTIAATLSTADEFSMKQIPAWLSLRNDNSADLVTFLHTRRCRKQLTHIFTYYSQLHYEVGSMSFPILPIGKLIFREICYLAENQQSDAQP